MIERFYGRYRPVCDVCEKVIYGTEGFREAVATARAAGWEVKRDGEDWLCTCGDCLFRLKKYDTEAG